MQLVMENLLLKLIILTILSYANGKQEPDAVPQEMPLSYFKSSGMFESMNNGGKAFIDMFTKKHKPYGDFNMSKVERSELEEIAKFHAICQPYVQTVKLISNSPSVSLYPPCVLAKRCGGCCGHSAMECRPTKTNITSIKVIEYTFDGESAKPKNHIKHYQVEEHTACECQCKVDQSACNNITHKYDDYDCSCTCRREKQEHCPSHKWWDENVCACVCRSFPRCGSGYTYNLSSCRCEEVSERSRILTQLDYVREKKIPSTTKKPDLDPCKHKRCGRRYKAVLSTRNVCICEYDRSASRRRG